MRKPSRDDIVKITLEESEIPRQWYNIVADMPNKPEPYRNPATGELLKPEDMKAIFPDALIAQEVSTERFIEIPDEVREIYKQWRPSPLYRARNLRSEERRVGQECRARR